MLTLEQVRATLSREDNEKYTDEEVLQIRDELYTLAEIIYEKWSEDKKKERETRQKNQNKQTK
jgi:hypothetical protein